MDDWKQRIGSGFFGFFPFKKRQTLTDVKVLVEGPPFDPHLPPLACVSGAAQYLCLCMCELPEKQLCCARAWQSKGSRLNDVRTLAS